MLRIFSVGISVSAHVCFLLDLILICVFLKKCTHELGIFNANQTTKYLRNQGRTRRGLVDSKLVEAPPPPVILLLAVSRRLFCLGSFVILEVARCYLWLFTLYINIKIGKIVVKC